MMSLASTLHEKVGEVRQDLDRLVTPQGTPAAARTATVQLTEIVELTASSPTVSRAARHVEEAIDRVLELKVQAKEEGSPLDAEQTSHAVNLLEDPMSELAAAVNGLPKEGQET